MAVDSVIVPVDLVVDKIDTSKINGNDIKKQLEGSMSSVRNSINNILGSIDTSRLNKALASSVSKVEGDMQKVEKRANAVTAAMEKAGKSSSSFTEASEQVDSLRERFNLLEEQMRMIESGSDWEKRWANYNQTGDTNYDSQLINYINLLKQQEMVEQDLAKAESLANPINFINDASESAIRNIISAIQDWELETNKLNADQKQLQTDLHDSRFSDEYTEAQRQAESLRTKLIDINDKSKKMDAVGNSSESSWENLRYDAEKYAKELDNVLRKMEQMRDNGTAYRFDMGQSNTQINRQIASYRMSSANNLAGVNSRADKNTSPYTDEYNQARKELAGMEQEVSKLESKQQELELSGNKNTQTWAKLSAQAQILNDRLTSIKNLMDDLVERGQAFKLGRGDAASTSNEFRDIDSQVGNLSSRLNDVASSSDGAITSLSRVSSEGSQSNSILSALGRVASSASGIFKKLGQSIRKTASELLGFGKNARKGQSGITKFFKYITRYILRRIIFQFLRNMTQTVKKGMNTLATQFPEINTQLSGLVQSFNKLKGSITTAFQPIISYAIPTLRLLMDALSEVAYKIGSLLASLTGQSYVYKATAAWEDYASSIDKAKNKLAGYDKLEVINEEDKNSNLLDNVTFEKAEIDSSISNLAEMLKNAWQTSDFSNLGKTLSDALLSALDLFNSNAVPKITEGINNIADSISSFMDSIDFGGIGEKLATGINDIVNGLDANAIGTAIGSVIDSAVQFVYSLLDNIDFTNIGYKLGQLITSAIERIDWTKVGASIVLFFTNIGDFLIGLLEGINWTSVGESLNKLLVGAFDKASEWIQEIDWFKLGQDLWTSLDNLITGLDLDSISDSLWTLLGESLAATILTISGFVDKCIDKIVEYFDKYITNEDGTKKVGIDLIEGIFQGIIDLLTFKYLSEWIRDHVLIPFIDGFKKVFKINSPSKVMEEQGKFIIDGLFEGIKGIWEKVKGVIAKFKLNFINAFTDIKNKSIELFEKLWEGAKKPLNWLLAGFETVCNGIINGINKLIGKLNTFSIDVPGWVSDLTGITKFGFNIPKLNTVSIPRLAQGAVIPPNKQFLAMLGDQTSGTNIEAPLDTIKQALIEVLGQFGTHDPIVLNVDGKTLAKVVWDESEKRYKQTGKIGYVY